MQLCYSNVSTRARHVHITGQCHFCEPPACSYIQPMLVQPSLEQNSRLPNYNYIIGILRRVKRGRILLSVTHTHTACTFTHMPPSPPPVTPFTQSRVVCSSKYKTKCCMWTCICKFNVYLLFGLSSTAQVCTYFSHACPMLKQTFTSHCTALVDVMSVLPSCVNRARAH